MKLHRKIQLTLFLTVMPVIVICIMLFTYMYGANQRYDRVIANASEAGRFSINFKEDFDYNIYLLIAGHSSFDELNPYQMIDEAKEIVQDLLRNTQLSGNQWRAQSMMKLLGNLEKYVKRIELNKLEGGRYDENIDIWENDIQIVTSLIQSMVLEYTYYETSGMEEIRQVLAREFQRIAFVVFVVIALLFIMGIVLSIVIPNSIVRPIHHLNEVTNQVAQGDLSVRANIPRGAEVRQLGLSLNSMIIKIENLLKAVKEDEEELRVAELELLQAQINPHFLYNTLDTIIWLAETGESHLVVDMVTSLSDFFRTSLNHGDGMFTLEEERKHVGSYLQIQQVRYQDILEYEMTFDSEVLSVLIPKITLQPLVENALYHGIKNRRGKGKITIHAFRENENLIIEVKDNGIGMTVQRLEQIKKRQGSYGLFNVHERIKLRFGEGYGLSVSSVYGQGTCVSVTLPMVTKEQVSIDSLKNEIISDKINIQEEN